MRYLQGKEIDEAEIYMKAAILETEKSVCSKSKRGVVIVKKMFDENIIVGRGYNNPVLGRICYPEHCYNICNQYCAHAEQNAIFNALFNIHTLKNSRLYHIKVKNGEVKNSGKPSCIECSKLILKVGIEDIVLKHDEGYGLYSAEEFYDLSLDSFKQKTLYIEKK